MKSQLTLLLLCMFACRALSLKCYECIPSGTAQCTTTQVTCPSQCFNSASTVTAYGTSVNFTMKTCGVPELCQSGSVNFGIVKMNSNIQCCATDLCNSQTISVPATQSPNGRMCYTCDKDDCSKTVNCEGNEDRCIAASITQGSNKVSVKGCTTRNLCQVTGQQQGITMESMSCCEGNLCNGSERFTLSFLLMLVPLLSSIFLY